MNDNVAVLLAFIMAGVAIWTAIVHTARYWHEKKKENSTVQIRIDGNLDNSDMLDAIKMANLQGIDANASNRERFLSEQYLLNIITDLKMKEKDGDVTLIEMKRK